MFNLFKNKKDPGKTSKPPKKVQTASSSRSGARTPNGETKSWFRSPKPTKNNNIKGGQIRPISASTPTLNNNNNNNNESKKSNKRPLTFVEGNITLRRGQQSSKIDTASTPDDLSRSSSITNLNVDTKSKGAKPKKAESKDRLDKVTDKKNDKKLIKNNNKETGESLGEVEALQRQLKQMADDKSSLALQFGEQNRQIHRLQDELKEVKMMHQEAEGKVEQLIDENSVLRKQLRDVANSPLSDNEKQQILYEHRQHNSAPASIATNLLDDGGDITACPTPEWDKHSSSNVSEVSVACLQDKINQMQETHYSTNEELQATLQELTDLQKQLTELQQENLRLNDEKNLMFESLCRQTERLNDSRNEVESLKQFLCKDENGQFETAAEREQKLVDLLKKAQEEREAFLMKQEQLTNDLEDSRQANVIQNQEIVQLSERVKTLESTLDAKHAEHKLLDQELAQAKDQSSSRQIEINRLKDLLENARTKINELEQDRTLSDKSELDELLDNARKEKDALESEVAHLKEQLALSKNEIEKLKEQVSILQEECKVTRNNAKTTQSDLEYKLEKLQSEKGALSKQLQEFQDAVNELQMQAQCQTEDKRQLSSVLSETQRNLNESERKIVELENELSELKRVKAEQEEEWEKFQNDLLTSVRVANDFKTEAQQDLQKLIMENKAGRDRIKQLEIQIEKLKGTNRKSLFNDDKYASLDRRYKEIEGLTDEQLTEEQRAVKLLKQHYEQDLPRRKPVARKPKDKLAISKPSLESVISNPKLQKFVKDENLRDVEAAYFSDEEVQKRKLEAQKQEREVQKHKRGWSGNVYKRPSKVQKQAKNGDAEVLNHDKQVRKHDGDGRKQVEETQIQTVGVQKPVKEVQKQDLEVLKHEKQVEEAKLSRENLQNSVEEVQKHPQEVQKRIFERDVQSEILDFSEPIQNLQVRSKSLTDLPEAALGLRRYHNFLDLSKSKPKKHRKKSQVTYDTLEKICREIDPTVPEDELTKEQRLALRLREVLNKEKKKVPVKKPLKIGRKNLVISRPTEESVHKNEKLRRIINDPVIRNVGPENRVLRRGKNVKKDKGRYSAPVETPRMFDSFKVSKSKSYNDISFKFQVPDMYGTEENEDFDVGDVLPPEEFRDPEPSMMKDNSAFRTFHANNNTFKKEHNYLDEASGLKKARYLEKSDTDLNVVEENKDLKKADLELSVLDRDGNLEKIEEAKKIKEETGDFMDLKKARDLNVNEVEESEDIINLKQVDLEESVLDRDNNLENIEEAKNIKEEREDFINLKKMGDLEGSYSEGESDLKVTEVENIKEENEDTPDAVNESIIKRFYEDDLLDDDLNEEDIVVRKGTRQRYSKVIEEMKDKFEEETEENTFTAVPVITVNDSDSDEILLDEELIRNRKKTIEEADKQPDESPKTLLQFLEPEKTEENRTSFEYFEVEEDEDAIEQTRATYLNEEIPEEIYKGIDFDAKNNFDVEMIITDTQKENFSVVINTSKDGKDTTVIIEEFPKEEMRVVVSMDSEPGVIIEEIDESEKIKIEPDPCFIIEETQKFILKEKNEEKDETEGLTTNDDNDSVHKDQTEDIVEDKEGFEDSECKNDAERDNKDEREEQRQKEENIGNEKKTKQAPTLDVEEKSTCQEVEAKNDEIEDFMDSERKNDDKRVKNEEIDNKLEEYRQKEDKVDNKDKIEEVSDVGNELLEDKSIHMEEKEAITVDEGTNKEIELFDKDNHKFKRTTVKEENDNGGENEDIEFFDNLSLYKKEIEEDKEKQVVIKSKDQKTEMDRNREEMEERTITEDLEEQVNDTKATTTKKLEQDKKGKLRNKKYSSFSEELTPEVIEMLHQFTKPRPSRLLPNLKSENSDLEIEDFEKEGCVDEVTNEEIEFEEKNICGGKKEETKLFEDLSSCKKEIEVNTKREETEEIFEELEEQVKDTKTDSTTELEQDAEGKSVSEDKSTNFSSFSEELSPEEIKILQQLTQRRPSRPLSNLKSEDLDLVDKLKQRYETTDIKEEKGKARILSATKLFEKSPYEPVYANSYIVSSSINTNRDSPASISGKKPVALPRSGSTDQDIYQEFGGQVRKTRFSITYERKKGDSFKEKNQQKSAKVKDLKEMFEQKAKKEDEG